jgi:predicted nucleic acid-binding protein
LTDYIDVDLASKLESEKVKYYLEKIQETNFRLSDALINKVLEITNEK